MTEEFEFDTRKRQNTFLHQSLETGAGVYPIFRSSYGRCFPHGVARWYEGNSSPTYSGDKNTSSHTSALPYDCMVWCLIKQIQSGFHGLSRNLGAITRFHVLERWRRSSLRTRNSVVTCDPHCYLALSARCI